MEGSGRLYKRLYLHCCRSILIYTYTIVHGRTLKALLRPLWKDTEGSTYTIVEGYNVYTRLYLHCCRSILIYTYTVVEAHLLIYNSYDRAPKNDNYISVNVVRQGLLRSWQSSRVLWDARCCLAYFRGQT